MYSQTAKESYTGFQTALMTGKKIVHEEKLKGTFEVEDKEEYFTST